MKKTALLLSLILMCFSFGVLAQRTSDIPNGKDYALVSRFKGSVIEWHQHKAFDKYYLLELHKKSHRLVPKEIEGEITRIQYSAGKQHSILEIAKSYEAALKQAGFTVTLTLDETNSPSNLNEKLYFREFSGLNQLPSGSVKPDHDGKWSYLEAEGQKGGKTIYVVIYITNHSWPLVTFDAVEVKGMEAGLVTATSIDKGIASAGHVALAGVYFDSGKATIKAESQKALEAIAAYLKAHPGKEYLVVGHTDNAGGFHANVELSGERAVAVVDALTKGHGVDAGQVKPFGVGPAAPVASNATEAGRAKNRRVELVER
jgi:OmpA-OmpF porin, OOP family